MMPKLPQSPTSDRLLGGLYGLLIGDALGVPYEFESPDALPSFEQLEMEPPKGYKRSHAGVPIGSWSDDGAQALCLLASLLYNRGLDLEDLGRRFRNWWNHGYMAVDGRVFDIGVQTTQALRNLEKGVAAREAGPGGEWDNGNGSLMRVLPLALWHRGSDKDLFEAACEQSLVTHTHPRSQICCALYCLWARIELSSQEDSTFEDSWRQAVAATRELLPDDREWRDELSRIEPDRPPGGKGSGYVVDCLHSARWALEGSSFEDVVRRAVSLGNDTDTTAAVAGGIAGIRWGTAGIPKRWFETLRDRQLLEPLIRNLIDHHS